MARLFRYAAAGLAFSLMPVSSAFAQGFPWEPVTPPVYTPKLVPNAELPKIKAPTRVVPSHDSEYGFVRSYRSDGLMPPPLAPGGKARGWVAGHYDADGKWVAGHPR